MGWTSAIRPGVTGDESVDVVVVGFGGAGATAAVEAADRGARVLVLDRFDGGGSTVRCGGVYYAGGGTSTQRAAGVEDSPEAMLAYLRAEADGVVSEATLRAFCQASVANHGWLEALGVSFPPRLFEGKAAYPPDHVGLYYSGNEKQRAGEARPAPRGHVPDGIGQRGHVLFRALESAVLERGVEVRRRSRVTRLVPDDRGRVVAVDLLELPDVEPLRRVHGFLFEAAVVVPELRFLLDRLEVAVGRTSRVPVRGGVVIAAGGYGFNRGLLREHAPAYAAGMPLGTPGDDGSGLELGRSAGGVTGELDSCAACRFLYPPEAFVSGLLVDDQGERLCDESLYSATVSRAIAARRPRRAWLVLDGRIASEVRQQARRDERLRDRSLRQLLSGEMNALIYRKATTAINLGLNRRSGWTLADLERRCAVPAGRLERTVTRWNEAVRSDGPEACGKLAEFVASIEEPPFIAIRCDLGAPLFPSPTFSLGGLRTDGETAAVLDRQGAPIPGLYAAGRSAVGVCSRSYVSGLSLADCVFSGRNAGRSAVEACGEQGGVSTKMGS